MKTPITLLFLLSISICFAQNLDEEITKILIQKWKFEQFEDAEKNGGNVIITKTKYVDSIFFEFKANQKLIVVYSDTKRENYTWKLKKRKIVEITSEELEGYNSKILGEFEIHYLEDISQLFLQRKNTPHNGIMLKL